MYGNKTQKISKQNLHVLMVWQLEAKQQEEKSCEKDDILCKV